MVMLMVMNDCAQVKLVTEHDIIMTMTEMLIYDYNTVTIMKLN